MKRKRMVVLTLILFIFAYLAFAVTSFGESVSTEPTSSDSAIEIRLSAGDLDRDGRVTVRDRSMLLEAFYYGKAVADFAGMGSDVNGTPYESLAGLRDLDEDGRITVRDLQILMKAFSFGRGIQIVPYH